LHLRAQLYQQFDADSSLSVPAENFGGWRDVDIELAPAHTALVIMHAWDSGQPHQFPGWRRAVEYTPRARHILREVFPPLLSATRHSPLPVFHVVGGGRDYYSHLPGHKRALALAGNEPVPSRTARVTPDPIFDQSQRLRHDAITPGADNAADVAAGLAELNFAPQAAPIGDEGVAENSTQLAALCHAHGINHLIYVGFAINWCLLMSPGGMVDMARYGCLCSTIREAVTAVENRETAREEREKQQALWRVSVNFGFVFSLPDFVAALRTTSSSPAP
jgi:hypothetical protein